MPRATPLPALYLSHGGGPCFSIEWAPPDLFDALARHLDGLAATLPAKPKAVLVISGHWETAGFTVQTSPKPPMLYDYSGFPAHTYELKYPAPGSPTLAARVRELLTGAGLACGEDDARGFDHGVFVPFMRIFPGADIPVVQLSMEKSFDPLLHFRAGEALAPLRREGVLIVGSGNSFHNLRFPRGGQENAGIFDAWLTEAACHPDPSVRRLRLLEWAQAPQARLAQPREDHLVPLFVAAGAAGSDPGARDYADHLFGFPVSGYRFG
ncbi:MAG: dioxygenase [Spirochaetes bacterium]|nr:dioxygenase [Spirochaetota bacterium]